MARKVRYVPEGHLVEVTCRTFQGRFLLKPSRGFRELFVGVLARAQELYPVAIHFFACLSNHFHLLLSPQDAQQLARFMQFVNTNLSKEAGRLHGWRGKLIERRYSAILVADEPAAQIARLRYLLSHGAKEGLVPEIGEWPGPHAGPALAYGHSIPGVWFDRTKEHAAKKRGEELDPEDLATHYQLELAPLPCWAHLPEPTRRRYVREMITQVEAEAADKRRREGSRPLGRDRVLLQHPHQRPERIAWSPAPFVHAATKAARIELYQAYGAFVEAYYHAKEKLLRGDLTPCFPNGCFPPPLPFLRIPLPA